MVEAAAAAVARITFALCVLSSSLNFFCVSFACKPHFQKVVFDAATGLSTFSLNPCYISLFFIYDSPDLFASFLLFGYFLI